MPPYRLAALPPSGTACPSAGLPAVRYCVPAGPSSQPRVRVFICGVALLSNLTVQLDAQRSHSEERARAHHLLMRTTYGPRPGDVDRVLAIGLDEFITRQLEPESIPDDAAADALRDLAILRTPTETLAQMFRERRRAVLASQPSGDSVGNRDARNRRMAGTNTLGSLLAEYPKATVIRAVQSERQLFEVMVDFWSNHFNVYSGKGAVRYLLPEYIEQTIRPHALGRFEDLLIATASSPAMLFYLDNVQSVTPGAERPQLVDLERRIERARQAGARGGGRRGGTPRREDLRRMEQRIEQARERMPTGLNENYARELLELHTLGVDGGFTQQDVVEVARVFTGWSMHGRAQPDDSRFVFNEWAHDDGAKVVLGVPFPAGGGMDEGIAVLEMLAAHPSTMRHVSTKLCQRFVADVAPAGCVEAAVAAWHGSNGDVAKVVRAILQTDDFWAAQGNKTKTPLEFVVSAVRAVEGSVDTTLALPSVIRRLGQPLYGYEAPTGYPETQDEWVNAGALLDRLNIAIALASGQLPGVASDLDNLIPLDTGVEEMIQLANERILNGSASNHTLDVWRTQVEALPSHQRRTFIVGLAIGSPEFQRQ